MGRSLARIRVFRVRFLFYPILQEGIYESSQPLTVTAVNTSCMRPVYVILQDARKKDVFMRHVYVILRPSPRK